VRRPALHQRIVESARRLPTRRTFSSKSGIRVQVMNA
jgi:hypothetical protein